MMRGAARWLADNSAGRMPVLGVDDAHRLDDFSAALVFHVAATGAAFVLATVRSGEHAPDPITALWKDGLGERLEVQPLGRSDTAALVESLLGGRVEATTREKLWAVTQGNALYVRELVRGGVADGRVIRRHGMWCWPERIVAGRQLVELLVDRFDAQPARTRRLIELVAFGEPLEVTVLERVGVAIATIEEAEDAGLLRTEVSRRDIEVWLAHPVFGEIARAAASPLRRREACRALMQATARADAGPEELVRRAVWCMDGGVGSEPGVLTAGAGVAMRAADLPLARRLAVAAVAAGGGIDSVRILAHAHILCGEAAQAEAVLGGVDDPALSGPVRAGLAAVRAWNLTFGLGRPDEADAVLDAADRVIIDGRDILACQRANFLTFAGRPTDAIAVADKVRNWPDASGSTVLRALMLRCQSLVVHGRFEAAVAAGESALALDRELYGGGWSMGHSELVAAVAGAYLFAGRLDDAQALLAAEVERTEAVGWRIGAAVVAALDATIHLARGAANTALARLRGAAALVAEDSYSAHDTLFLARQRAAAAALVGEADEAAAAMAVADQVARPWNAVFDVWGGSSAAWVAVARGEISSGVDLALAAADRARDARQFGWELAALYQVVRFGACPSYGQTGRSRLARRGTDAAAVSGPRHGAGPRRCRHFGPSCFLLLRSGISLASRRSGRACRPRPPPSRPPGKCGHGNSPRTNTRGALRRCPYCCPNAAKRCHRAHQPRKRDRQARGIRADEP